MRNNVYGGAVYSCAGVQREIQGMGKPSGKVPLKAKYKITDI